MFKKKSLQNLFDHSPHLPSIETILKNDNKIYIDVTNQNGQGSVAEKVPHKVWKYYKKYGYEDVYIVMDGDKWVALSTYARSLRSKDKISTGLTGVLTEYRRKGICKAVKIHALLDLKKKGFKKVFTGNEENNPMFQINLMLGFKKIGEEFGCKLTL